MSYSQGPACRTCDPTQFLTMGILLRNIKFKAEHELCQFRIWASQDMNLLNSKMRGEMERSERGPAFDKMQKNKTKIV